MRRVSRQSLVFCVCVPANPKQAVLTSRLNVVQASLPVHNQVLPSIEGVDGSDPLATLQNPMARLEAKEEEDEEEEEDSEEEDEEDGEDTDLDDWEPDPPRPFDPHDLCKWRCRSGACAGAGRAGRCRGSSCGRCSRSRCPPRSVLRRPVKEALAVPRVPSVPTSGLKPGGSWAAWSAPQGAGAGSGPSLSL